MGGAVGGAVGVRTSMLIALPPPYSAQRALCRWSSLPFLGWSSTDWKLGPGPAPMLLACLGLGLGLANPNPNPNPRVS